MTWQPSDKATLLILETSGSEGTRHLIHAKSICLLGLWKKRSWKQSPYYNHNKARLFPRKHKYPSCFLHWSGNQFPSPYGQTEHQKHSTAAKAFPLFHLRYLHSLVLLHFSFPVQQQLAVTQAYPAQSGAGSVHPSPWQRRAFHSSQSTAASIPEIPIHHLGKYKLLNLRVGFPEDSQGQALGNMLNWAPSSKCPKYYDTLKFNLKKATKQKKPQTQPTNGKLHGHAQQHCP